MLTASGDGTASNHHRRRRRRRHRRRRRARDLLRDGFARSLEPRNRREEVKRRKRDRATCGRPVPVNLRDGQCDKNECTPCCQSRVPHAHRPIAAHYFTFELARTPISRRAGSTTAPSSRESSSARKREPGSRLRWNKWSTYLRSAVCDMFTHKNSTERKNLNGVTRCTSASAAVGRCCRCTGITRILCLRALPTFLTTRLIASALRAARHRFDSSSVFPSYMKDFYRHFVPRLIIAHDGNDVLLIASYGASGGFMAVNIKK